MHRRSTKARLLLISATITLTVLLATSVSIAQHPRPPARGGPMCSVELVMDAYARGLLTYDEMLVQRQYAYFAPAMLDPRFRSSVVKPGVTGCPTAHLLEVFNAWQQNRLGPRARAVFDGLFLRPTDATLTRRPTQPGTGDMFDYTTGDTVYFWDTPSGLFRIHWVATAPHAPDLTDTDGDGAPDYIEEIGGYLDFAANVEFNVLGYLPPPSDASLPTAMDNGGDEKLDVYIGDLTGVSGGVFGYVMPEWPGPDPVRDDAICYMVLDNDYDILGDIGVDPAPWTDAIYARQTCAHELHHTSQCNYDGLGGDSWFFEQTSLYMQDKVYPDDNLYVNWLSPFFTFPEWGLDYFDYPGGVWPIYIDKQFGSGTVREIWENTANNGVTNPTAVESWVTTFANHGTTLADQYTEFMEWNYVCGQNDDGNHYIDGALYGPPWFGPNGPDGSSPWIDPEHVHALGPATPDVSSPLTIPYPPDHLGTNYVQFDLDGSAGGVTIDFKGNAGPTWAVRVIKVSRTPPVTYTTEDMVLTGGRDGFLDLLDTDAYDRLIMCVNVVSTFGDGYSYLYRAHFDEGMVSGQPPRAPEGVVAQDAPDDNGGAIRVTWALSKDDGRGANDVTGYDVLRSDQGATTGFSAVATMLPPGTFEYVDSPTPQDCTDYWYKVRVHDSDGFATESEASQPAQSRDDTAPVALAHLSAQDKPGDLGHAVVLDWGPIGDPGDPDFVPGYAPPADFGEYRVYRSETPFTDATGMTPIGTVGAPFIVRYVDDDPTLENGTEYYYAVTCADDACPQGNEDTTDLVVESAIPAHDFEPTYPAGLSLIGLPARPFDPSPRAVFGELQDDGTYELPAGFNLMRYEPGLSPTWHVFYPVTGYSGNPDDPFLRVAPGRGFWLVLGEQKTFDIDGRAVAAGDFQLTLVNGWQQIGNPYDRAVEFVAATISRGGNDYDLDGANAAGIATNYAWIYNAPARMYQLVHPSIPFAVRYVPPYLGMWYRAMTDSTMTLPRPTGASAEGLDKLRANGRSSPPAADDWEIQIAARIAGTKISDVCNAVGVRPDADAVRGVVSPPPPTSHVDLYIVGDEKGARYATDYVTTLGRGKTWDLVVETDVPKADVVVEVPDLTGLPRDCRAYLVDLDAGQRRSLRTTNAYTFNSGPAAGARHLQLEVTPDVGGALAVTGLTAMPSRGPGAEISFRLTAPASVRADILNIAGRVVATLGSGGAAPAGRNYLSWDGKNQAGSVVPAGAYLVRVTAAGETGERARAVTSLAVGR